MSSSDETTHPEVDQDKKNFDIDADLDLSKAAKAVAPPCNGQLDDTDS